MDITSKMQNNSILFENYCIYGYDFYIYDSPAMKQLLKKLHLEFPYALSFSCTWHEEANYCS